MSLLRIWTEQACVGKAVWLADLREALRRCPEAERSIFRLRLLDGGRLEREMPFLLPESQAERRLLLEYWRAGIFNLLAAYSGSRLEIFLPEGEECRILMEDALRGFSEAGYAKALKVAGRLCAAMGKGNFGFQIHSLAEWTPMPPQPSRTAAALAPLLRETAEQAVSGLRCGLDVGGTDIKLALSREGKLIHWEEYDWDPSRFSTAEELIEPILALLRRSLPGKLDSLGLSFPDVVIGDRILGGETPKTRGMRDNPHRDYEKEFAKIGALGELLSAFCKDGGQVHLLNDGSMAAFSAAVELACEGEDEAISGGVFAHSLGTDLGSGWLTGAGTVPAIPLELYDLLIDLGSWPQRSLPPEDLRATRNENSLLPGARRYLGQAAAYRLAYALDPELLEGFLEERDGLRRILTAPKDLRKPCLEGLMRAAEAGNPAAEEVFRQIGRNFGQISREIEDLLHPETRSRFLFGRFVRHPRCFALLREGCAEVLPELRLYAADENLARSPLMRQLAGQGDGAVARFGQAVGAIYYGLYGGRER